MHNSINKTSNKKKVVKNRKKKKKKKNRLWILKIVLWTIILSGSISFFANMILPKVNLIIAFIILIAIILLGIISDIVGVAVTAASETPFHAMAAKKIDGAKIAVKLIRNADKVSNFSSDVIGDVCGVVSGAIGALILSKITTNLANPSDKYILFIGAVIGAIIAAITVGGKAVGKTFAIKNCNDIIFAVSKVIHVIKKER
ncbi:hypothetical protein [Clostridium ganghwense]|uniref:DUF21 domain-containing protein n=1 Tax=Clostridium ganghwense TaxID=312089 RepID=A0ABT4CMM6_9CLOT|nr:hypothetical protein [Clostridium ganghwense]MCY6370310.1 hypothetical protein [Clostridium ganghwense]